MQARKDGRIEGYTFQQKCLPNLWEYESWEDLEQLMCLSCRDPETQFKFLQMCNHLTLISIRIEIPNIFILNPEGLNMTFVPFLNNKF